MLYGRSHRPFRTHGRWRGRGGVERRPSFDGYEDGGGGVGRRSDALAVTIAHKLKMRFMSWQIGQAVDADSQMAPHLLENTRNRVGNGRPHPELDPGIRMRFLPWRSGLAVSPRPHREPRRASKTPVFLTGFGGVAIQGNLGRPRSSGSPRPPGSSPGVSRG